MAKIKPNLSKKPKKSSDWEIVDIPIAQTGTQTGYSWSNQQAPRIQPTFQGNYASSKTTGNRALTSKEKQALKVYGEKRVQEQKEAEYAARQARIKESVDAQNQPLSAQNIMTQSQSTGDKMSLAMNTPFGNPTEYPTLSGYMEGLDYINPGKFIGDMASGLGAVPYNVQQGNYGQAFMGVAAPLATGALAGIGTQGIGQFVNNLVNPLAGTGEVFNNLSNKYLPTPKVLFVSKMLDRQVAKGIPNSIDALPKIDLSNKGAINVKNDFVKYFTPEEYDNYLESIYHANKTAYDNPLVEFKGNARPSSFFETLGNNIGNPPGKMDNILQSIGIESKNTKKGKLFKEKFCLSGSECAKSANAITNTTYTDITGLPFNTEKNAHNAWHMEDQMTRHGGVNVTGDLGDFSNMKIGDRVLMGNGVNQSTYVPGYTADPSVRHAGMYAGIGVGPDGQYTPLIFESGKNNAMFINPLHYTFAGENSALKAIRPAQLIDDSFGKGLVDKNIRYAFRDKPSIAAYSSQNKEVQKILNEAEKHREVIKRTHDITNDEFDELLNNLIGIGAQETKLNAALPGSTLAKAKIELQNVLNKAGLTKPIKQTLNIVKKGLNSSRRIESALPDFPGTSVIEMEAAKLSNTNNISFEEALSQIKSKYKPKPKYTYSTVEPSKGMFRQKFQTKTDRFSGLGKDLKDKNSLENALGLMSENYNKIKKAYPNATPRQLVDITTLMWNSPGKALNPELVDFYVFGKNNPNPAKFNFDYVKKINSAKNKLINIHPKKGASDTEDYFEFFKNSVYPEIQYKKGGKVIQVYEKKQEGGKINPNWEIMQEGGDVMSNIDLHLPKYPIKEKQNVYARPYIFGLSPEKDINVYGAGANFGLNFLDNSRNTFGVTGGVNNTAVSYPGGFEISSDPYKSFGLRYVYRFKEGGNIQDQQGYLASNLQNFTPKKVIKGNKKGTNITTDGMAFPITANGKTLFPNTGEYYFPESSVTEYPLPEAGSGYKVVRSSERKGKTHKVIGPDGTVKFFGDSKLGQHPKDPARKKAFYARHKKNLAGNPYFRAFARKTWEEGGMLPDLDIMAFGGNLILEKYQRGGNTLDDKIVFPMLYRIADAADYGEKNIIPPINKFFGSIGNNIVDYMLTKPELASTAINFKYGSRPWLFENVRPVEYPGIFNSAIILGMGAAGKNAPPVKDEKGDYAVGEEAWRKGLGLNTKSKYIIPSKYKPSKSTEKDAKYYTLKGVIDPELILEEAKKRNLKTGENVILSSLSPYMKEGFMDREEFSNIDPLQNFKMGVGEDEKGKYVSIYDKYDFEGPLSIFTTPYEFYDRYYYKPEEKKAKKTNGGSVWEIVD